MRVWMLSALRIGVLVNGLLLAVMAGAGPAWGAAGCVTRADLLAGLARVGEAPIAGAITAAGGGMLEVLAKPDGSTWTIIMTKADQCARLLDFGTDWQALAAAPEGDAL